jgi:hypothetical protein
MTPTLIGRWQTRLLLYVLIQIPITALFALYANKWELPALPGWRNPFGFVTIVRDPFVFLTAILIVGLVLDIVYIQLQRLRWDNDWPFAFQFVVMILEFFIVYGLVYLGALDSLLPDGRIPLVTAACHFAFVFVPSFLALLGFVQILFLRWRFKGGELTRFASR